MPTYSYACTACGHAFDIHQAFSDASLTVCPECEGRLRKVFSSVGVVFKGSGFYRNDARSGSTPSSVPAKSDGAKAGSADGAKVASSTTSSSSASSSGTTSASSASSSTTTVANAAPAAS